MEEPSNLRILIIDDNSAIHQDFRKILACDQSEQQFDTIKRELFGVTPSSTDQILSSFSIDSASQGQEGVSMIKQAIDEKNPYSLAFVDIRMPPGWDGIETIKYIWDLDRDIQIVICTAYSDYSWQETVDKLGMSENLLILKKPFDSIAVRQLACALTKKWQQNQEVKVRTDALEQMVYERSTSLEQSLSITRATLDSSDNGIVVIDNLNYIVDYNSFFVEMWMIPETLIDTRDYIAVQGYMLEKQKVDNLFLELVTQFNSSNNASGTHTIKLDDGRFFECYTLPQILGGVIVGRVWSFRDITQRIDLEKKLQFQATHDSLTSLPNRTLLIDRIEHEIDRAKRHKSMFAVMFIDLDRFKLVNDSYCHGVGDALLLSLAKRLKAIIRAEDTFARLSGDEFILIYALPPKHKNEDIVKFASKILKAISNEIPISEQSITITGSLGISIYPANGKTPDELLRKADLAMYRAKSMGGDQLQFYTEELNDECKLRLEREAEMRQALLSKEFFLEYQPQYNTQTGELIAVEALIRWQHPVHGVLYPLEFIPLAEETGLIIAIGEWVLRTACEQNKAWQDSGYTPFRIAVNVATKQFMQPNLVAVINNIMDKVGLKPEYLEIEVTENVIISNANVINTIVELKKLGVFIVLDDFGTGNAGLNYLRSLPIDQLKIDQSFVEGINFNHSDEIIIQTIIAMANSLNLDILAEGVENHIQLKFLKSQNCQKFQGFYFSRPLVAEGIEKLLKKIAK